MSIQPAATKTFVLSESSFVKLLKMSMCSNELFVMDFTPC